MLLACGGLLGDCCGGRGGEFEASAPPLLDGWAWCLVRSRGGVELFYSSCLRRSWRWGRGHVLELEVVAEVYVFCPDSCGFGVLDFDGAEFSPFEKRDGEDDEDDYDDD